MTAAAAVNRDLPSLQREHAQRETELRDAQARQQRAIEQRDHAASQKDFERYGFEVHTQTVRVRDLQAALAALAPQLEAAKEAARVASEAAARERTVAERQAAEALNTSRQQAMRVAFRQFVTALSAGRQTAADVAVRRWARPSEPVPASVFEEAVDAAMWRATLLRLAQLFVIPPGGSVTRSRTGGEVDRLDAAIRDAFGLVAAGEW